MKIVKTERFWCFCNQPSIGTMIVSDHDGCTIQWFHCECLRKRSTPEWQMVLSFLCEVTPDFKDETKTRAVELET